MLDIWRNPFGLRTIKTARTKEAINRAARAGFFPLVKPVIASPQIRTKYAVLQNPETGEIEVTSDFRLSSKTINGVKYETVIDFTHYYPHHFDLPYAAYLIPSDLQTGEKVFLEDLIEDLVGMKWNQGDTYRLKSCEAIWNGKDLVVQYDEKQDRQYVMG